MQAEAGRALATAHDDVVESGLSIVYRHPWTGAQEPPSGALDEGCMPVPHGVSSLSTSFSAAAGRWTSGDS